MNNRSSTMQEKLDDSQVSQENSTATNQDISPPDEISVQSSNCSSISSSKRSEDDLSENKNQIDRGSLEKLQTPEMDVCSIECAPDVKHWGIHVPNQGDRQTGSSTNPKPLRGPADFSCPHCSFTCRLARTLYRHLKSHMKVKISNCPLCDAKFDDMEALICHMNADHKSKTFSCIHCSRVFPKFGVLKIHMATHKKEAKFNCKKCDFKTHLSRNLRAHMRHCHSRAFKCSLCQYKTGVMARLKSHLLVHSDEKLHACAFCDFKTKWKKSLGYHMLKNHSTGDAYPCPLCKCKFSSLNKLKVHAVKHTLPPPDFLKI